MTDFSRINRANLLRCGGLLVLAFAFVGCNRDAVRVQDVPKESDPAPPQVAESATPPAMPANPHAGMDMGGGMARPQVKWTLPDGWQDKPVTEFRLASFDAKGKDGRVADVSVIPMPTTGREVDLVNMWRQQLQLPAVTPAGADKEAETISIGSEPGKMFEFASEQPMAGSTQKARMVVAMLIHDGTSFFFKMTGEDSSVTEQKPAFLDFLKSISFASAPETAVANPHAGMTVDSAQAAPAETSPAATAALPSGWKEVPATQFLLAKYEIPGSGDAKAEVSVSMLTGTGGGVMANVSRWRGQLGLAPLSEEDFSKAAQSLNVAGTQATMVDMTGTDKTGKKARMIGVIAPQTDQTWFYKLMGDPQIVEQQKDAFTKFIQTTKFSNAP